MTQHVSESSIGSDEQSCGVEGGGRATLPQVVLNLVAAGLGTGVCSLPWCMAGASLLQGVATIAGIMALTAWTSMILVDAAEKHQVFDMGGLVGLLPGYVLPGRLGRRLPTLGVLMQAFVNVMIWVTHWVTLTSYVTAISDSASTILDRRVSRWQLVTGAALLVLPLNFLDMRRLSFVSALSLMMNVYMLCWLGVEFARRARAGELPGDICLLGAGRGGVAMVGAVAQCATLQMCVPPMYADLARRNPRRFGHALWAAYTILAMIYIAFAVLGYFIAGPGVPSNIMLGLPKTPAALVVQIGAIVVTAPVYPMMVLPMVASVEGAGCFKPTAEEGEPENRPDRLRRCALTMVTLAIVGVSFLGALAVRELGFINVVDGSICACAFTALVPGLIGWHLVRRTSVSWRVMMSTLFAFGFASFVFGVYFSDNYEPDLLSGCALYGRIS